MTRLIPRALAASILMLLLFSSARAGDESAEDMTKLLKLRLGTDQVEPAQETGVDGVYQTRFGNKFAYLIDGGRYVFIGDLVDLKTARNLTELSRRELVVEELADFGEDKQIIFPAENEELAVLNVFTDTSCGYCQQLHKEVKYLQEAGISVHYYPYPRGGSRGPGYADLKKVWCADDQQRAMSIAKKVQAGSLSSSETCESASYVDDGYLLGNRIGVTGTPALFASDGAMFNGYVPYQQLIPQLLNK
ncbi:MAG: DsbC family protein [Gammaproteobacteria bacterium]|nr:DsbC family protein [Gammaproteobacteria bacterium]MDH3446821.1 DsbC family protein [Gammaproteobacteria bacterium]